MTTTTSRPKLNCTAEILTTVRGKARWIVIARCSDVNVAYAAIQLRDEVRRVCQGGAVYLSWDARAPFLPAQQQAA